MGVGHFLEKNLAHHAENIDGGNDDGAACDDGAGCVEVAGHLKRTYEDGHLSDETGETGETQVGQTSDDITHREEGHNLHQSTQLTDITSVSTAINHTDEGKEESRHQSV